MAVPTFTKSGSKSTTTAKLDKSVFGVEIKSQELVRSAYEAYLANGRNNLAVTKTRGLVRGGGRKPWKQKGTGRARFGSIRNPIWRTGGVVFGPTGEENFTIGLNKKAKKTAIRQALTMAADKMIVIESFDTKGKTAEAAKLLAKFGATRNTLVALQQVSEEAARATNNLPNAKVVSANYLNVYDIVNADCIVIDKPGLEAVTTWLGGDK